MRSGDKYFMYLDVIAALAGIILLVIALLLGWI